MADASRDDYEAILIPDRRITAAALWAAESTYTEDDPQCGPITATGEDSDLVLEATGTPVLGSPLQIRCQRAGMPGINRAGIAYRAATSGDWYGWDTPPIVTGYELVIDETSATSGSCNPDAAALDDGTLLVAYDDFSVASRRVRIKTRAWGGSWAAAETLVTESTTRGYLEPQLVLLPSGRVLLFCLTYDDDTNTAQVSLWVSDDPDGGASAWRLAEPAVLPDALDTTGAPTAPSRLRAAYNPVNGQILLIVSNNAGNEVQFASSDVGCSFEKIGTTHNLDTHDVVCVSGVFVVAARHTTNTDNVAIRRTASAFVSLSTVSEVDTSILIGTPGHMCLAVLDGAVHVFGRAQGRGYGVSADGGVSWERGFADGACYAESGVDIIRPCATAHRGRIVLFTNQTTPAANVNSLTMLVMGGPSTVTLPPARKDVLVGRQAFWTHGWVGHENPATFFANNSVGVPTSTRQSDGSWQISAGLGVTARLDAPITAADEIIARASLSIDGGAGIGPSTSLYVRWAVGASSSQVEVRLAGPGTIAAYDATAAAIIDSSDQINTATRYDVLVAIQGQNAVVWYREYTTDGARAWTLLADTAALTLGGASTPRVRHEVAAQSDASLWEVFALGNGSACVSVGTYTMTIGASMADGFVNPDDLFGRPLPAASSAYLNDGVSVRGLDGPCYRGETFNMEITHPYPVESMIPLEQPSPRSRWQAASAAADMAVAWQTTESTVNAHAQQDTIGCYLGSCYASHVRWQGYIQGTGWTTIADIDRTRAVTFQRTGHSVYPATSGVQAGGRYYARDELVGGYLVFTGGLVRRIVANTEGNWDDGAIDEKRPVILLDTSDMTGAEPASGTVTIVFPDSLTIAPLLGVNAFRGYRLVFHRTGSGASDPPGGKFRVGVAMIGPVVVLGKPAERRIGVKIDARVADREQPDGTTRSRVLAPARRTITVPLGTVDLTSARGTGDPDYVLGSATAGAEPLAHRRDLPLLLAGLCSELDGSHTPIVWIPRLRKGAAYTDTNDRAGGAVYGRIVGWPGYVGNGVGLPQQSEVVQLGSLTIREET